MRQLLAGLFALASTFGWASTAGLTAGTLALGFSVVIMPTAQAQQIEPAGGGVGALPNVPANGGPNLDGRVTGRTDGRQPARAAQSNRPPVRWNARPIGQVGGLDGMSEAGPEMCEEAGGTLLPGRRRMLPPPVVAYNGGRYDFVNGELSIDCFGASLQAGENFVMPAECRPVVDDVVRVLRQDDRLYIALIEGHGDSTPINGNEIDRWRAEASQGPRVSAAERRSIMRAGPSDRRLLDALHTDRARNVRDYLTETDGVGVGRLGTVRGVTNDGVGAHLRGFRLVIRARTRTQRVPLCIPPKMKDGKDGKSGEDGTGGGWLTIGARVTGVGGGHDNFLDTWGVLVGPTLRIMLPDAPVGLDVSILTGLGRHNEDADEDEHGELGGGLPGLFEVGIFVPLREDGQIELFGAFDIALFNVGGDAFYQTLLFGGGGGLAWHPKKWFRGGLGYRYLTGSQGPDQDDVWGSDAHGAFLDLSLYLP